MSERYVRRYVRNNVKRLGQKEWRKICQKEFQKDMSEDMSSERVSKDSVRKNGKRYVRKMSERMSERMSEDMSGRTSENMSQVYVHTQIWITRIHVCTNGILWMASCFLFYLAYCSKYCWLNFVFVQGSEFGLEAMAEVVVERPETIFIGTANQVAKGSWACVALQVDFCWCWAHVRVHGARLALHMLGIWCLSWKKSWRETSGMWHMKGGLFQMRRASKSWRSALQSFVLRPRFGEDGVHEWEDKQRAEQGHLCRTGASTAVASIWLHGLRTPWDVVVALQTLLHFWTQLPFDGAVWCMWCVCVCVELQAFCIFGLNCLLAGRSDALRAMTFTGTYFLLRGAR